MKISNLTLILISIISFSCVKSKTSTPKSPFQIPDKWKATTTQTESVQPGIGNTYTITQENCANKLSYLEKKLSEVKQKNKNRRSIFLSIAGVASISLSLYTLIETDNPDRTVIGVLGFISSGSIGTTFAFVSDEDTEKALENSKTIINESMKELTTQLTLIESILSRLARIGQEIDEITKQLQSPGITSDTQKTLGDKLAQLNASRKELRETSDAAIVSFFSNNRTTLNTCAL